MKEQILYQVRQILNEKIKIATDAMQAAQESANAEGKSSAGDKYETARAMSQIERNMYAQQVEKLKQEQVVLEKLNQNQQEKIILGSLVHTSVGIFWLGIGIGKLLIENQTIMAVSANSPIGKMLLGKTVGNTFDLQGKKQEVREIK